MFRKTLGLLVLALILPLAACDDSTSVGEPGLVSLKLTDAAGDFTQAHIVIDRIELVGDEDAEAEEVEGIVLLDEPYTTDLLTLSNDIDDLVEEETVAAGTYSQLRLVISDACIGVEQEDESEMIYASEGFDACGAIDGPLQMPSYGTSGLKINMPGGSIVVDGNAYILLLDFDVSESFGHEAGGSGMWVMDPVIHAEEIRLTSGITVELSVPDSVDLDAVGSSLADFEANLDVEEEPVFFTDDDEDGVYTATFFYLTAGEYELSLGLQEGVTAYDYTLDPTSPQTIPLGESEQRTISFEVTSAAPSS